MLRAQGVGVLGIERGVSLLDVEAGRPGRTSSRRADLRNPELKGDLTRIRAH